MIALSEGRGNFYTSGLYKLLKDPACWAKQTLRKIFECLKKPLNSE